MTIPRKLFIALILSQIFIWFPIIQGSTLQCEDLGDVIIDGKCQSCRGLFPSCKRCGIMEAAKPYTIDTVICLACDEGMYMYPYQNPLIEGQSGTYFSSEAISNLLGVSTTSTTATSRVLQEAQYWQSELNEEPTDEISEVVRPESPLQEQYLRRKRIEIMEDSNFIKGDTSYAPSRLMQIVVSTAITQSISVAGGSVTIGTYTSNYCALDCEAIDYNTVNGPKYGRCMGLGYYCMYGNETHGCLQGYLPSNVTVLATDLVYSIAFSTFKSAQIVAPIKSVALSVQGDVANCLYGTGYKCDYCMPPHLLMKGTENDTCTRICPRGSYPNLTPGSNATRLYVETHTCAPCHPTCLKCMLGTSNNCTSCPGERYLSIENPEAKTGQCLMREANEEIEYIFNVHGDRYLESTLTEFQDLTGALNRAYSLANQIESTNGANFTIFLEPSVLHYIVYSDLYVFNGSAVQDRLLQRMPFTLNILQGYIIHLFKKPKKL
ncbi:hypothetical protein FGO68_gene3292 [Halteria grandinella]|uniref:Uncharacterized protein n=1 Tax=Halteria grandinella TaxID=5974 RepID=A0A8J8TB92_HALGN|nr:hypothetical protein FGO68_gene3292 [Halteria grandinella]